jgi:hypothetical protein
MRHQYRIEAVEPLDRISHGDFFSPRKAVTLVKIENGETVKVLLPCRGRWRRGDLIELEDFKVMRDQERRQAQSELATTLVRDDERGEPPSDMDDSTLASSGLRSRRRS